MTDVRMDYGAQRHVDAAATAMLVRIAEAIERDAQRFAPVDTGELRASIQAGPPVLRTVRVTAGADYAGYVELGTRYMRAQPYLAPALYRERVI